MYVLVTNTGPVRYYREVNGVGSFSEPFKHRATLLSEWMASAHIKSAMDRGEGGTIRAIEVRG